MLPRHLLAAVVAISAALCVACSGDDAESETTTIPPVTVDQGSPEAPPPSTRILDLADRLGCHYLHTIPTLEGPIRSGSATEGISCSRDRGGIDIFTRGPLLPEQPEAGGSLENIARILNAGLESTPSCGYVVTDDWIITSNDRDVLENVAEELGGNITPVQPISSPVSYTVAGCI